jgi:hypothetical protein
MLLAASGTFGRSLTDSVPLFLVLSVVALISMGFGSVVGGGSHIRVAEHDEGRGSRTWHQIQLGLAKGGALEARWSLAMLRSPPGWRESRLHYLFCPGHDAMNAHLSDDIFARIRHCYVTHHVSAVTVLHYGLSLDPGGRLDWS